MLSYSFVEEAIGSHFLYFAEIFQRDGLVNVYAHSRGVLWVHRKNRDWVKQKTISY